MLGDDASKEKVHVAAKEMLMQSIAKELDRKVVKESRELMELTVRKAEEIGDKFAYGDFKQHDFLNRETDKASRELKIEVSRRVSKLRKETENARHYFMHCLSFSTQRNVFELLFQEVIEQIQGWDDQVLSSLTADQIEELKTGSVNGVYAALTSSTPFRKEMWRRLHLPEDLKIPDVGKLGISSDRSSGRD
eukprot:760247-Hanusia_phi.AAC.1